MESLRLRNFRASKELKVSEFQNLAGENGSAISWSPPGLGGYGPVAGAREEVRGPAVHQALQQTQGRAKRCWCKYQLVYLAQKATEAGGHSHFRSFF